jgi:hypothetical protein
MIGDPGMRWKRCWRVRKVEERSERRGSRGAGMSVGPGGEGNDEWDDMLGVPSVVLWLGQVDQRINVLATQVYAVINNEPSVADRHTRRLHRRNQITIAFAGTPHLCPTITTMY